MITATVLPTSVLRLAASIIVPGRNGPRRNHDGSAPTTSAPANWNRLRTRSEGVSRTWSCRIVRPCPELVERPSQRPPVEPWIELASTPHALKVGERAPRRHQCCQALVGEIAIGAVSDRTDHQIVPPAVGLGDLEAMFALDL